MYAVATPPKDTDSARHRRSLATGQRDLMFSMPQYALSKAEQSPKQARRHHDRTGREQYRQH
jgi:hypothetical protein